MVSYNFDCVKNYSFLSIIKYKFANKNPLAIEWAWKDKPKSFFCVHYV